jgi:hypothetical protein
MEPHLNDAKSGHLFTVEVLLNEMSSGLALEKLLQLLNRSDEVIDYKVISGKEMGKLVDSNLQKADSVKRGKPVTKLGLTRSKSVDVSGMASASVNPGYPVEQTAANKPSPSASRSEITQSFVEQFELLKQQNSLIRLTIVKGQGLKLDLPCRIVHFDTGEETVTVYHVDDKQVYTFKLNEVEDFSVA